MKICFIVPNNLYLAPYLGRYTDILKKCNVGYDIIYWDRHGINELINEKNIYNFEKTMEESSSKIVKIINYYNFVRYIKNILKQNNYDRVFVMGSVLGVFLYPLLKKDYQRRYIIDIRDYTFEHIKIFYRIEKELISNSLATIISSDGYKKFLPSYDYVLAHNIVDWDDIDRWRINSNFEQDKRIRISYIGLVRFLEKEKTLIAKFANDPRFHITFIGKNADKLEGFINDNNIKNVTLEPMLLPQDTLRYCSEANIINNIYGSGTPALDYALSNKLYLAAQMRKPILVCPNTYMEEISCEYNFGISLDIDKESIADELYEKYKKIEWDKLNIGCEEFLKKVSNDNKIFEKFIRRIIQEQ